MVPDKEKGKKEIEGNHLELFLEAYEEATGNRLRYHPYCSRNECPDFICTRQNGETVGIELTQVMMNPSDASWARIIKGYCEQEPFDALFGISRLIEKKEETRSANYGRWTNNTILLLELMDCSLISLRNNISKELQKDFSQHGFAEVWLGDYTGVDAYGDIELFGLFPPKWWGYYPRINPERKPYG